MTDSFPSPCLEWKNWYNNLENVVYITNLFSLTSEVTTDCKSSRLSAILPVISLSVSPPTIIRLNQTVTVTGLILANIERDWTNDITAGSLGCLSSKEEKLCHTRAWYVEDN